MSDESQEIKIIGVDKENIKTRSDKNELWVVPFKLSSNPDQSWQNVFYEVQKKNSNAMKRKARIDENFMFVEVSGVDDLQMVLEVLKIEVVEANVQCEKDYQKKLKIRKELAELQKRRRDATQKLQEDSDKLTF